MKILHFDILEGFKKGGITQFENDNLNETYKIYLYKNKMRFDVDGKTIRLIILDKNKAGQVLTLKKGEASNEIILPVTKELTKIDGIYDAQIIFTKNDGYNEKTMPFRVTIKNDLLTDMESELVSREEYQYLIDRFEEAVRNIENFKVEIRNEYLGMETDLNDKYILFKDEVNNSNTNFKNRIDSTVNSIDEKVNSFDSRISKNTKEIDDAKGKYDTLETRLDRENEKVYETINSKDFLPFEGENVTVEHSKVGFTKDMKIEGATYQNLMKKVVPVGANGNLTINGDIYRITATENGSAAYLNFTFNGANLLKANTTYTLITKNYKSEGANSTNVVIYDRTMTKPIATFRKINDNVYTVTLDVAVDSSHLIQILFYCGTSGYTEVSNQLMILEGDWTSKEIPAYFEGVKSVGEKEGKISILSYGKNLIDIEKILKRYSIPYQSKDGIYTFSTNMSLYSKGIFFPKDNSRYSISYKAKAGTVVNFRLAFAYKDGTYSDTNYATDTNNFTEIKATSAPGKQVAYIRMNWTTEGTISIKDLQIEKGETVTNFENHKEDKKEILLTDGFKGLPNGVCDTLEQREDGVYLVRRVGNAVFDGSSDENIKCLSASNQKNVVVFAINETNNKLGSSVICDRLPSVDGAIVVDSNVGIGSSPSVAGGLIVGIKSTELQSQDAAGVMAWLKANPITVYYELAESIETKLDISSLNLETFKDTTHVFSENSISPNFKFKAPVNIPATISTLRTRNENLGQENKELKEEVDIKTLKLHGQDVELTNSDLDLDFRIFEIEMSIGVPINLNMKGMRNMARSPFEMMKILILNNNYDREDIEYKASRYLKGGRMSQVEYNEIISLMDANEVIQ